MCSCSRLGEIRECYLIWLFHKNQDGGDRHLESYKNTVTFDPFEQFPNFDSEVGPSTYYQTSMTNMTFGQKPRWWRPPSWISKNAVTFEPFEWFPPIFIAKLRTIKHWWQYDIWTETKMAVRHVGYWKSNVIFEPFRTFHQIWPQSRLGYTFYLTVLSDMTSCQQPRWWRMTCTFYT